MEIVECSGTPTGIWRCRAFGLKKHRVGCPLYTNSQRREPASANLYSLEDGRIRKLEKVLTDLRSGMMNLQDMKPRPYDWVNRVEAHHFRMMKVEKELFVLKQGRLL